MIDGKGGEDNLFDAVLEYCVEQHWEDRVRIIDPASQWAVGLNYLEPFGTTTPAAHSPRVIDGLARLFHEDKEFKPLLEKWGAATVRPLIEAGLTVCEMEAFTSTAEPKFRELTLHRHQAALGRVAKRWKNAKLSLRKYEQAMQLMAVENRAAIITDSPMGEAMFGQLKSAINWREAMDTGQIILVRCHEGGPVSRRLAQAIGVTVVHQIMEAAEGRARDFRPDAWVVCDEFQEFACDDFVRGLSQMRSFHVWFVMAHQFFEQLDDVPKLLAGLKANADGKVAFELSYEDAAGIVRELYQEQIHGDAVKHLAEKYRPKESTREVRGRTKAHVEADADSFMDILSDGTCWSSGSGAVDSFGVPGFLGAGPQLGSALTQQSQFGGSSARGHGSGSSHTSADIEGASLAVVPWYEYERYFDPDQWYSPQEQLERCTYWLMNQHTRRASFWLAGHRTIPIITAYVRPPVVTPEEVAEAKERILSRCGRRVEEVLPEIQVRVATVLKTYEEEAEHPEGGEGEAGAAPAPALLPPPEPIVDPIGEQLREPKQPERTR